MIKLGTHEIKGVRVGSVAIGKVMVGSDEVWSAVPPVPDAMVVEGAGTEFVNGLYLRDGDFNDRPKYAIPDSIYTIYWGLGRWNIGVFSDGVGVGVDFYLANEDVVSPDLVSVWEVVAAYGTAPAPTVRRATAEDFA